MNSQLYNCIVFFTRSKKTLSEIPKIGFNSGYKILIVFTILFVISSLLKAEINTVTRHLNGPGDGVTVQIEMTIGACDADTMNILLPKVTDNCDTNVDLVWSRSDEVENLNAPLAYGDTTTVFFLATDNAGNQTGKELVINVKPQPKCAITAPVNPPPVLSTGNTLSALTDACIVSYDWFVDGEGWEITSGNGSPTIFYNSGSAQGVFTLIVTDEFNCQSQCQMTIFPVENRTVYEASAFNDITSSSEEVTSGGDLNVTASPNPFRRATNIKFTVGYDTEVTVEVYNTVGKLLDVIYDDYVKAGETVNSVFKRKYHAKQVYLYRVTTNSETVIGKLISE